MRRRLALFSLSLAAAGCLNASRRPDEEPLAAAPVEPTRTDFAGLARTPGQTHKPPPAPMPVPHAQIVAPPVETPTPALSSIAFDSPLLATLRGIEAGRPDAGEALTRLPQADRDVVVRLLKAADLASRADLDTPGTQKIQAVVDEVNRTRTTLANYGRLELAQALFVARAEGLARYTPLPSNPSYRPGRLAELYVELHNARPEPVGPKSDQYEIKLHWKLTLKRADGGVVARTEDVYAAPLTRSPLRESWLSLVVNVPQTPGLYFVTVEVHDEKRPANTVLVSKPLKLTVVE